MTSGTGTRAYFGRPSAGKTGTTDDHADAWFCGYTPTLQATVWVGYPQAEIPMESVHGISVAGGTFPAEIWRRFMEPALERTPYLDFREPTQLPEWQPFRRGPHALSGYYYGGYSDDDSDEEEGEEVGPGTQDDRPSSPSAPATPPSA